jgi:SAM-dependent methyltransferase
VARGGHVRGVADAARAVADATRALTDATRELTDATRELGLSEALRYRATYADGATVPWERPPASLGLLDALIDRRPPARALDVGCGTGRDVVRLARAGWTVVGVDLYAGALRRAAALVDASGVSARVTLERLGATALDALDGRFDLVLDVFGPASDLDGAARARYVAALARRLAPGGVLAIFTFRDTTLDAALDAHFTPIPGVDARHTHAAGRWLARTLRR